MTTTWDSIRSQVREAKYKIHINLSHWKRFQIDLDKNRVYFIGVNRPYDGKISSMVNRQLPNLYFLNWDSFPVNGAVTKKDKLYLNGIESDEEIPEPNWTPILNPETNSQTNENDNRTSQNQHPFENLIDYHFYQPNLTILEFQNKIVEFNLKTQKYKTLLEGENFDVKVGGFDNELISYLKDGNIFVKRRDSKGKEVNLTQFKNHFPDVYCGGVDYIMKEEFNRTSGYFWQSNQNKQDSTYRILYTLTDESKVNVIQISSDNGAQCEFDRYPYPNTPNAHWELRLVEFCSEGDEITNIINRKLIKSTAFFPEWTEYLVRFGWLPYESNAIWCQVLSRDQTKSQVLEIPLNCFYSMDPSLNSNVLFEDSRQPWVNITDLNYFFKDSSNNLVMIWSAEESGYRHLYKITKLSNKTKIEMITKGNWVVLDQPIFVDKVRGLVYFMGNRDNSFEAHLYVTSLNNNGNQILRLTPLGHSYKIHLNLGKNIGVMLFSNLSTPVKAQIFQLQFRDPNTTLPILVPITTFASSPTPMRSFLPKVENFQFSNTSGDSLNGIIFKPSQLELSENLKLDYQFSTLLYVYGGPKSQLVTNEFQYTKLIRCYLAAQLGYIVVVIDGRGTANRGLQFESHIHGDLGSVELDDQVDGLNYLIHHTPIGKFINRQRIAITGWSYGGYLSLMAMVKYSHLFKLCISGAPVIDWAYYDSAYTERYLGFPDVNQEGYKRSSLLNYVDQFPNEENRILICHGMMDNNVHFTHTEQLINALIKYNKPYQLQIFPNERHGLKEPNSLDHFDTLMFYWLKNYL